MKFIRVHGHVIPIRDGNLGAASERYGKRAGKMLGKVGPLSKKAKQFHELAKQQASSPNPKMKSLANATKKKAMHFEKRSAQASALGGKLGNISEGIKARGNFARSSKIMAAKGVAHVASVPAVQEAAATGHYIAQTFKFGGKLISRNKAASAAILSGSVALGYAAKKYSNRNKHVNKA